MTDLTARDAETMTEAALLDAVELLIPMMTADGRRYSSSTHVQVGDAYYRIERFHGDGGSLTLRFQQLEPQRVGRPRIGAPVTFRISITAEEVAA